MDTLRAFAKCKANRGKELMVFDWHKAAKLIKERKAQNASAGLSGDWENNGGKIFTAGKPVTDEYTYLASRWATPEIEIDGELIECYIMQNESPEGSWNAYTKWPESALKILSGKR